MQAHAHGCILLREIKCEILSTIQIFTSLIMRNPSVFSSNFLKQQKRAI
jgi:hypothetical protein